MLEWLSILITDLHLGLMIFQHSRWMVEQRARAAARLAWRTSTFASRIEGFLRVSRGGGWRLEGGEIVQNGTPEELRVGQGVFRTRWRM